VYGKSLLPGLVLPAVLLLAPIDSAQHTQPPQTFRSRVVLVPIDVRVLDGKGNPVTDLKPTDFTIIEDGVPQEIAHFSTQAYSAMAPAPDTRPVLRKGPGLESSPLTHRTFLIVLGRGRLQGPAKGMDAVLDFMRKGLLPQDHVGVLAYGRATDLTTDHESIVRLLERYRERHESIEALLDHWFDPRGLQFAYGDPNPPPAIRRDMEALLDGPGLPAARQLATPGPPGDGEYGEDQRRVLALFDKTSTDPRRGWVYNAAARQDLEQLHAAVEYLRLVEGEKHLILFSEEGLLRIGDDPARRLAAMAADARVSISPIHTGGVPTSWRRTGNQVLFLGPTWDNLWANGDSRFFAEQTGGIWSFYRYASETLGRLERATRFHYVLGYYPPNPKWDGSNRRIKVTVSRPNVRVLYRRGYYAREELLPYDRRELTTQSRITSASAYRVLLKDISLTLSASVLNRSQGKWQVRAALTVDPTTIRFKQVDDRHVASIDVAVFVGAPSQRLVGEIRRRVDLNLEASSFIRLQQQGVAFTGTIDLKGPGRYVKAVVYDYGADRLGSAVIEIR